MKKRIIYRFTGRRGMAFDVAGKSLINGQFISRKLFDELPDHLTIRQEIKITDPNEVCYVESRY